MVILHGYSKVERWRTIYYRCYYMGIPLVESYKNAS